MAIREINPSKKKTKLQADSDEINELFKSLGPDEIDTDYLIDLLRRIRSGKASIDKAVKYFVDYQHVNENEIRTLLVDFKNNKEKLAKSAIIIDRVLCRDIKEREIVVGTSNGGCGH